ncbi:putative mucin TcMUCII [Trypanosoma cruzi]|nr:putative mucin TcMUCII [Trypanosoma cruzi]
MMTCRLLCALLVLALCCCPSVCATATGGDQNKVNGSTAAQSPGTGGLGAKNTSATSSSTAPAVALPSKSPGTGAVEIPGNGAEQPHGTSGLQGAGDAPNRNEQEPITESSTSDSAEPTEKAQERAPISGTGGTEPLTQAGTGQTQSGNPTSQASSAGTGVRGSPDTPSPGPIPKQEQAPSGSDGSGSSGGSVNPTTASSSVTGTISAQSQKEHAPTTTTTTTTTKAPTTTTTTTTEAPTTTTTRAPSRLREIDGSLSSSAWVCAPLLLAVSALAYTTLG